MASSSDITTGTADKPSLPSASTFSFTAPFPTQTGTIKQRRVSLALPSSPRAFPAWDFRDDTGIDSHVSSSPDIMREKKGKMRRLDSAELKIPEPVIHHGEKKQRKKWTEEETQMLVDGCNKVSLLTLGSPRYFGGCYVDLVEDLAVVTVTQSIVLLYITDVIVV